MNKVIDISVRDKIAVQTNGTIYVCGNSDYIINFDFDDEWSEHEHKTARFVRNGSYVDVVFSGHECPVPVITDTYNMAVGVYAGNLHTTTPAMVSATKSILCGTPAPAESEPDVYEQIKKLFEDGVDKADAAAETATAAKDAAQEAQTGAETANEAAQTAKTAAETAQGKAEAAQAAIEGMEVTAETRNPGEDATVTKTQDGDVVKLTFGIPKGEKGEKGDSGDLVIFDWDTCTADEVFAAYDSGKRVGVRRIQSNGAVWEAYSVLSTYNFIKFEGSVSNGAVAFATIYRDGRTSGGPGNAQMIVSSLDFKKSGDTIATYNGLSKLAVDIPNVAPETKTEAMTQAVGADADGKLWTEPGGGKFVVTATPVEGSEDQYTFDRTFAEVKAAADAGETVEMLVSEGDEMSYHLPLGGIVTMTEYNIHMALFGGAVYMGEGASPQIMTIGVADFGDSSTLAIAQLPTAEELDGKLSLSGGTMTGDLKLKGDPTFPNMAATKSYVDGKALPTPPADKALQVPISNKGTWEYRNGWLPFPVGITKSGDTYSCDYTGGELSEKFLNGYLPLLYFFSFTDTWDRFSNAYQWAGYSEQLNASVFFASYAQEGLIMTDMAVVGADKNITFMQGHTQGLTFYVEADDATKIANMSASEIYAKYQLGFVPVLKYDGCLYHAITVTNGYVMFAGAYGADQGEGLQLQTNVIMIDDSKAVTDLNGAYDLLTLSGGTMTGPLILADDPTSDLGAATKQYVDNEIFNATESIPLIVRNRLYPFKVEDDVSSVSLTKLYEAYNGYQLPLMNYNPGVNQIGLYATRLKNNGTLPVFAAVVKEDDSNKWKLIEKTVNTDNSVTGEALTIDGDLMATLNAVTAADSGKFLRVSSSGSWAAESIPDASEVTF